jgi:hypothetical protein
VQGSDKGVAGGGKRSLFWVGWVKNGLFIRFVVMA